jgi:hypothetical protein
MEFNTFNNKNFKMNFGCFQYFRDVIIINNNKLITN